jgi:acetyl-CoA carboxylase biotin carboxyl carrier protein
VTEIRAEITANVWLVNVKAGQAVSEGDELVILESMKMELPVVAPAAGTVHTVHVKPEDHVTEGDLIVTLA